MDYLSFFPEGPIKPLLELFKGFIRFLLKMDSEQGEKTKTKNIRRPFKKTGSPVSIAHSIVPKPAKRNSQLNAHP